MDITKLTSRAIQNKPASRRPSQAAKFDPSRLIRMGFNENPYGMSPKAVEAIRNTPVKPITTPIRRRPAEKGNRRFLSSDA